MKKIIFLICIILAGITTYAKSISESKVPVLVKKSFYQDYPKAEHVKWKVTKLNDYKASFKLRGDYGCAYYNEKGDFVESDITVEWKEVPFTGRMEIYHLNKKGHIKNVLKIINYKHDEFYLIDVNRRFHHYEILLDYDGNIIKIG